MATSLNPGNNGNANKHEGPRLPRCFILRTLRTKSEVRSPGSADEDIACHYGILSSHKTPSRPSVIWTLKLTLLVSPRKGEIPLNGSNKHLRNVGDYQSIRHIPGNSDLHQQHCWNLKSHTFKSWPHPRPLSTWYNSVFTSTQRCSRCLLPRLNQNILWPTLHTLFYCAWYTYRPSCIPVHHPNRVWLDNKLWRTSLCYFIHLPPS